MVPTPMAVNLTATSVRLTTLPNLPCSSTQPLLILPPCYMARMRQYPQRSGTQHSVSSSFIAPLIISNQDLKMDDEAVIAAFLFLFFVGQAARLFERNYDDMLTSIEEELERRQAMDDSEFMKEMISRKLQGEEEEEDCEALDGTEVASNRVVPMNV